jgi:hypothetical protein
MNKIFAKLVLYAPDDVYLGVKGAILGKDVYGADVKPIIYHALRKTLFGETKVEPKDILHWNVKHLPARDS